MMHREINSFADLGAPDMGATAQDERDEERAAELADELVERFGNVATAYVYVGGGFLDREGDHVVDALDDVLWERMDAGEQALTQLPNAPDDLVTAMAAKYARRHERQMLAAIPEWVSECAA